MGDPNVCGDCGYPFDDSEQGCRCGEECVDCGGIVGETHGDEEQCKCIPPVG
jgi:hypothetical protein